MLNAPSVHGAAWLLGAATALLVAAPDASAEREAVATRACAHQNAPASNTPAVELRSAVVCLIDQFRGQRGLPGLREQARLDAAAQGHSNQMVAGDLFAHGNPGLRITDAGFNWGAYGEAISTGFPTPRATVSAWLASPPHCRILLSPTYEFIGVGVAPRPVAAYANLPGTWTADLALPLGWRAPSGNRGPANRCPY